ncbi:MAG TPA: hypothetical protein VHP83_19155 [Aggregatilineaceae bacterium]|nr:hypothetical protein [Aggregatilineaceae bacterium]
MNAGIPAEALSLITLRRIVGGLALLMAVLMLAAFFAASWMETEDGQDRRTAWEIWSGTNSGDKETLNLQSPDAGGFGRVRGVDRLLILIPIGALLFGLLAIYYAFGRLSMLRRISLRTTALLLLILALLLLALPFIWQALSSNNWRGVLEDSNLSNTLADHLLDELTATYSTGQQIIYGLIALLAGIAAVALETPQVRAYLDISPAVPTLE